MANDNGNWREIVARSEGGPDSLIPLLQDIQAAQNYLPREALEGVAERLGLPLSQVYSVAAFYKALSLEPRGKHIVSVCVGTACHVRGAAGVVEELERQLGIAAGETSEDMQFTLETVNCLGACALGPIVVADGEYHGQMSPSKARTLIEEKYGPDRDTKRGVEIGG